MRFSINSKILLSRLVASGKAINNRPSISILGNFLLTLEESGSDIKTLSITASDIDSTVISRVEVSDADGYGSVCIDAKRLTELLKTMPDCHVRFDIDTTTMTAILRHPKGKYKLSCLSATDYPLNENTNPEINGNSFKLPAATILSAFDKVGFAIGSDDLYPQMMGMFWDITPDAITFVATNTRVLAKYRNTQTAPGIEASFILPERSISLIRAFISKQSEIAITITSKAVVFEGDDFIVRSTLVNGKFPPYNKVIPQNLPYTVTFDRIDFSDAISRVATCTDNQFSLIRFKISADHIDAIAQDFNYNVDGEESISCEYGGSDIEIGFSYTYLKGLMNSISTQKIIMKLCSNSTPGIFMPAENDEYGELTLVCVPISLPSTD